jgi:3-oxoadipate enol-lactonase
MVDVGGHRLRLVVSGSGPPVFLCLHGLVDCIEIWDRIWKPLSERGRVARLDQRGHGQSEAPPGPYRREDLAADVSAVIRELDAEKVILVGHSMGGIISMSTALAHREQVAGLVLIGTASQCNEKTAGWYERIAQAGEKDGNAGLVRAIYGAKSRKIIQGDALGIAEVTRMLESLYEDPLTSKLPGIECPVLLIVGDEDPMGSKASSIIAAELPNAELVTVRACGHWVHVDQPDAVLEAVERFVTRLDS